MILLQRLAQRRAGLFKLRTTEPHDGVIVGKDLVYRPKGFDRIKTPPFRRHLAAKFIR